MKNCFITKLWLISLCLFSLFMAGCFHVPDEDWLPNKNKIDTWDTLENKEIEQAIHSFMNWIDVVSSQRNDVKNNEDLDIEGEDDENIVSELENDTTNIEATDQEVENIVYE